MAGCGSEAASSCASSASSDLWSGASVERPVQRRLLARAGEELEQRGVEPVDARELLGHLRGERRARFRQLRLLHDPAPHGLAGEPLHQERVPARHVREMAVRPRDQHTGFPRHLDHAEFLRERQRVTVDAPAGRAAQQE
jgi:hypothetical protein